MVMGRKGDVGDNLSDLQSSVITEDHMPLYVAVELGCWPAVAALLCLGADKNVLDQGGNGLYHMAAKRYHFTVIEILTKVVYI
ncbi:unnamed protein product [Gongylonema pulchrum]|uniref:Uncharacterized protein n=1 Tax=Gongylonema pulchrum TaxID=637853 RepID=A0A3P6S5Y7_9BILA|nr:unnamed protein product [Gongylonema pulchrum]